MMNYIDIYKNINPIKKVFLAYLFTAIPLTIFFPGRQAVYVSSFLYVLYLNYRHGVIVLRSLTRFLSLILFIVTIQTIEFQLFSLKNITGLFINIIYTYGLITLLKEETYKYYIKVIILITVISFIFYLPSLIFPFFHAQIGKVAPMLGTDYLLLNQNFIIYTWEKVSELGFIRNSGAFTEPGSFSSYLVLALIFNIVHENKLFNKSGIIIIAGIITTFSSSGYVALIIVLIGYYSSTKKLSVQFLFIPLILILSLYAYTNLPFMEKKIDGQLYAVNYKGSEGGRFGSAFNDYKDFKEYPFFGRGILNITRFDGVKKWDGDQSPRSLSNGLTNQIVRYGIVGFLIYLLLITYSLNNYFIFYGRNKIFLLFSIFGILILAFGQSVLDNAPFLGLLFVGDKFIINDNLKYENINNHTKL